MSIWYQLEVEAIARDGVAVAKFFGLNNSHEEVRTDMFKFSFGGKNAPSLSLKKIVQQNPDLIFLVEQSIECDTVEWFVTRFDVQSNQQQFFWIQDFGHVVNKVSKKLLEEYEKDMPGLAVKHLNGQEGYEEFRWSFLFNDFDKAADRLNRAEEYKEMVNPWKQYNIKMYIVEFEAFGSKSWEGPYTLAKAERTKERLSKCAMDCTNLSIREVEPK